MTLSVDIVCRQGSFSLRARFEAPGGVTALFGRSGSGKTTLVGAIAGLLRPERGRIALDETVLLDTDKRVALPPHRRRVGYVFQDARLFPHLSVRGNLLFGRRFAPAGEPGLDLAAVTDLLGIDGLLARRPAGLSGGERQRVAIGRALLAKPRLLLMDEPLAALDAARKDEILPFLERLRDEGRVPIVYVSHALDEVLRLADTVVLLEGGRVTASGSTSAILSGAGGEAGPAAGSVLDATVLAHDDAFGLTSVATPAGPLRLKRLDAPVGAHRRLRVPAADVTLALDPPGRLSALNVLPGIVESLADDGPSCLVRIRCRDAVLVAEITRRSAVDLGLRPGSAVHAMVKSVALARGPAG